MKGIFCLSVLARCTKNVPTFTLARPLQYAIHHYRFLFWRTLKKAADFHIRSISVRSCIQCSMVTRHETYIIPHVVQSKILHPSVLKIIMIKNYDGRREINGLAPGQTSHPHVHVIVVEHEMMVSVVYIKLFKIRTVQNQGGFRSWTRFNGNVFIPRLRLTSFRGQQFFNY